MATRVFGFRRAFGLIKRGKPKAELSVPESETPGSSGSVLEVDLRRRRLTVFHDALKSLPCHCSYPPSLETLQLTRETAHKPWLAPFVVTNDSVRRPTSNGSAAPEKPRENTVPGSCLDRTLSGATSYIVLGVR